MTGADLHEILADKHELISDTWYYFLTVHMALLAIIYVAQRRARFPERIFLLLGYFGFLAINYMGQADNYAVFDAICNAMHQLPDTPENEIAKALMPHKEGVWIRPYLHYLYGTAAAVSTLIILFINRSGDHDD